MVNDENILNGVTNNIPVADEATNMTQDTVNAVPVAGEASNMSQDTVSSAPVVGDVTNASQDTVSSAPVVGDVTNTSQDTVGAAPVAGDLGQNLDTDLSTMANVGQAFGGSTPESQNSASPSPFAMQAPKPGASGIKEDDEKTMGQNNLLSSITNLVQSPGESGGNPMTNVTSNPIDQENMKNKMQPGNQIDPQSAELAIEGMKTFRAGVGS